MTTIDDARVERDDGMARVSAHADPEWRCAAGNFLIAYLEAHTEMFTDDLWALGLPHTREDRALGPLIMDMAAHGLIERSGEYRQRTRGHLAEAPVWRSLIYKGPAR